MSATYAPSGTYTRTPNVIYDLLPELGNAEMRIVLAVVRETFGHRREWAEISFTDFEAMTGLSRPSINQATDELLALSTADGSSFFFRRKAGRGFAYRVDEEALVKQLYQLSSLTDDGKAALPVPVKLLNRSLYKEGNEKKRKETKGPRVEETKEEAPTFGPDSWQAQYAARCLHKLTDFGWAAKAAIGSPERTVQVWADVFDRLHRLDGFGQDEIAAVMRWLLTEENWWIKTGNFRSAMKLRQKVRGEETTYFELFRVRRDTAGADAKTPASAPALGEWSNA